QKGITARAARISIAPTTANTRVYGPSSIDRNRLTRVPPSSGPSAKPIDPATLKPATVLARSPGPDSSAVSTSDGAYMTAAVTPPTAITGTSHAAGTTPRVMKNMP